MSEVLPLAFGLGLASAGAYGVASAFQHRESLSVAQRGALDPALLTSLARRPVWLLAMAADLFAVGLQAVALAFGPVALVQTLLVGALPVAVLLSVRLARRRLHRDEAWGVALCAVGLGLLAPVTAVVDQRVDPGRGAAAVAGAVVVVVVAALLLLRGLPSLRAVATGTAAGVVTGTAGVLLAVCAQRVGDPAALVRSLAPYALVVVGGLGLLLSQAAFQTGALGAPLAALTLCEPVVAVLLAVTVLRERLPTSVLSITVGALGAALAAAGVVVLARSRAVRPASS